MVALRPWLVALSVLSSSVFALAQRLPDILWTPMRESIQDAEAAIRKGEPQAALARYNAILYPGGVTVGVAADSLPPGREDEAVRAAARAVAVWANLLGPDHPLRWVPDDANAMVVVRFVEALPARAHDALGYIDLRQEVRWNRSTHRWSVRGTIYVLRSFEGKPLSFEALTHIAMHELGHLLGLEDVTSHEYLMGPMRVERPLQAPTRYEVEAVLDLRRWLQSRVTQLSGASASSR